MEKPISFSFLTPLILVMAVMFFVACASKNQALMEANNQYQEAEKNVHIAKHAPVELREAKKTLAKAKQSEDDTDVNHYSALASTKIEIARQTADQRASENELEKLQDSRKDILLKARNREAMLSREKARLAKQRAEMAESRANAAEGRAKDAQAKISELSAKNEFLQSDLQNLKGMVANLEAKETERGLELTLKDVLFATNKSTLKPGSERTINRLVEFLGKSPSRQVLIEGHTDSMGSEAYNKGLSEKRAQAVQSVFKANGIPSSRLHAEGYGEEYPVAPNDSKVGRQQNRRVEIIVLNEDARAEDNVRK